MHKDVLNLEKSDLKITSWRDFSQRLIDGETLVHEDGTEVYMDKDGDIVSTNKGFPNASVIARFWRTKNDTQVH